MEMFFSSLCISLLLQISFIYNVGNKDKEIHRWLEQILLKLVCHFKALSGV